ncbi:MAG TPA: ricin-type beta-trefoil lectin domain protein [Actinocrinis sp.]|nr:ricin-type beta-trefoil lectin domain protein [Actinocrinis sp.]
MSRLLPKALAVAAAAAIAVAIPVAAQATPPSSGTTVTQVAAPATSDTTRACSVPLTPGGPVCYALVRNDLKPVHADAIKPNATPSGYSPSSLLSAYNLASAAANNGGGQTVAVIENADDPNLESDLGTYRAQYGLPACTTANGCFEKVNQSGQQGNYPGGDTGWGTEASLDIDMVSAICPKCHIIVVEAGDLDAAQNTAVSLGAHYISNSWGTGDNSGNAGADGDYNHSGVVDVASTGDGGYGVSFPATSRYVVAAGGTSLRTASNSRGWSETAWSGSGAGCSSWESKPSWQTDSGCSRRTDADVSAVADPNTGVAVYDSYGEGGWFVVGGTSASSPIIASVYALAGTPVDGAASLYSHTGNLNDVTSGSDGSCSTSYLCNAGNGYDGPTGLGTPNGLAAFGGTTGGGGGGTATGAVTSGISGKCLDDYAASNADGTKVDLYSCNGTGAQQWTAESNGTLQTNGKCLDITGGSTSDGALIELWDCNGGGNQVWQAQNGELVNPASGKCLDDPGFSTTDGTQLDLWDCNGGANQKWAIP